VDGRRLTRSQTDKRLAGVCGGLAEYFGIDPILIRVALVILAVMGPGILLYIVLWIVMPKGEAGTVPTARGRISPAVRIAEERFVKGEITADELAQIRADLTRA
jgi:phage shock protein PspC (stress-responsive transcriptional regulator)